MGGNEWLKITSELTKQNNTTKTKQNKKKPAWVAQSVEDPTLDFSSALDSRVVGWSPVSGSKLSVEPA